MNNVLQRTCMGCNSKKEKNDLMRIVKNNKNEIIVDKIGKQEGRGAYICKNRQCLEKVIKNKRLEKNLKAKISNDIYENIAKLIDGGEFIG